MKNDQEKLLSSYMELWILYVLRMYSDDENPMTVAQISAKVTALTGLGENNIKDGEANPIAKTVSRRLQEMETLGNLYSSGNQSAYGEAFYRVMGGQVKALGTRPVSYYYEPILSGGDVSMICAAVESNHYLSMEETEFLIRRLDAACSYKDGEKELLSYKKDRSALRLPRRPEKGYDALLPPSKASVTLKKFSLLQYAIKHQLMVKVIPGTYATENDRTVFIPKREKESILNPYAMLCQNGQYYLIATHEGYSNPNHYRVDRLYAIELIKTGDGKKIRFKRREEIPVKLQKFFKGKKFDADSYTAKYPLMAYYGDNGIKKCELLCKKNAITVAIDYFGAGNDVKIVEQDDKYVRLTVFADYDNVKMFCVQQYTIVKPLFPESLTVDVQNAIKKTIDELDRFV